MYTPIHFKVQEFVSPAIYKQRGSKSLELMDSRILETMDALRKNLNKPITINNWIWNGDRTQSGYRDVDFYGSASTYANSLSQHKYGRAVDFLVKGMTAGEVRKHILTNIDKYPHITFLEIDINWVHIDCRNGELRCWSPDRGFVSVEQTIKEGA